MEAITERFINVYRYLSENKNISNGKKFAEKIGISPQLLTEITKGRNEVGLKAIQNTLSVYEFINPNWLLNGNGQMLKSVVQYKENELYENDVFSVSEPQAEYETINYKEKYFVLLNEHKNTLDKLVAAQDLLIKLKKIRDYINHFSANLPQEAQKETS